MNNTREKLIKLIQTAKSKKQYDFLFGNIDDAIDMKSDDEYIADHLIANGVTVQKWIPVSERLPDTFGEYIVAVQDAFGKRYSDYANYDPYELYWRTGLHRGVDEMVTHWMPLPEPPEGE